MKGLRVLAIAALVMGGMPTALGVEASLPDGAGRVLARVPADLAERGAVGALQTAARLAGLGTLPSDAEDAAIPVPPSVPVALAAPVGELLSAVRYARREFRAAVSVSTQEAFAAIAAAGAAQPHGLSSTAGPPLELQSLARRLEGRIDRARMLSAALSLAEVIERSLPELGSAPGKARRGDAPACDVVNALPAVCVGGDGANTYDEAAFIQIDLGGNDLYRNGPGTANVVPPVGISIDLAGNDHYLSAREATGSLPAVQGSAVLGIGLLLDLAGDDRYTVTDSPAAQGFETLLVGQAYAAFGVGVLDDREGDDIYEVRVEGQVSGASLQAQGYGSFGGVGALVDGGGNDVYEAAARPTAFLSGSGATVSGNAKAEGQGYGLLGGTGILADASGNDTALLEARTADVPAGTPPQSPAATAGVAGGGSAGFSAGGTAGEAGVGLASWGTGSTSWTLRARTFGPSAGAARIDGLGLGAFGGTGIIRDSGGDDLYRAEAVSTAVVSDDSELCACSPSAVASAGPTQTTAVGVGVGGGVGLVEELAGNDRYEIVARSHASAESHDRRAVSTGGFATASAGAAFAGGSAAGGVGGFGELEDHGGDDRYIGIAESLAEAVSTPEAPGDAVAQSGSAQTGLQAHGSLGGAALLRDLGGADIYSSTSSSVALAPGGMPDPGSVYTSAQGSLTGGLPPVPGDPLPATAMVVDLGAGTDVFFTDPPDPACLGTRGGQAWQDCSPGVVGGTNP